MPPRSAPSIDIYPTFVPPDVEIDALNRKLPEIAGRLGLGAIRGAWLPDGFYGLELPRERRQRVDFEALNVPKIDAAIPWLMGIQNDGKVLIRDVADMPHLLVAGTTGAGKSNAVSAALAWLFKYKTPQDVRVMLLDPKQTDLLPFASVPHVFQHVPKLDDMPTALEILVNEMHRRYKMFAKSGARDFTGYKGEQIPRILCVVDELALIMDDPKIKKPFEVSLYPLLQAARAAGIHMIVATQRPDTKVLSTRLKGNLPWRICFRVLNHYDSEVVMNDGSAAGLLGQGDGLLRDSVSPSPIRFQAPYLSDDALAAVIKTASKHDAGDWQLEGAADVVSIPEDLPDVDKAKILIQRLDYVSTKDLLDANICNSRSQAKKVLKQLRNNGFIGGYQAAIGKSPVTTKSGSLATP
jgi:S-DNA-T family DNA segregation ATPase FtsK/SpoIIIE